MLIISAKIRQIFGRKTKILREKGILPGVLYGPNFKKALVLEVDYKLFERVYKGAGESSLITLVITKAERTSFSPLSSPRLLARERGSMGEDEVSTSSPSLEIDKKGVPVLIQEVVKDPLTEKLIHVDFYQPSLEEEIEANIPLVFEGESLAVKDLGGTLVKNIHEVEVKALPQNLSHEIKVDIGKIKTFEDNILIKDLIVSKDVKILKEPDEIVALVVPRKEIEEELEQPIEEKVEEVEKVEKEAKKGVEKEVEEEKKVEKKKTEKEIKI